MIRFYPSLAQEIYQQELRKKTLKKLHQEIRNKDDQIEELKEEIKRLNKVIINLN